MHSHAQACLASLALAATLGITAAGLTACSSSSAHQPRQAHGSAASGSSAPASTAPTSAPATAHPVPDSTVPPPSPGSVKSLVPSVAVHALRPVALTATADYRDGVTAHVVVRSVHVSANGPGQVAGPGLEATVTIVNRGGRAVSIGNVVVNVETADGAPGVPMTGGKQPFMGSLPAGARRTAVYDFALPLSHRNPVRVSVSYSPSAPVALFVGNVQ